MHVMACAEPYVRTRVAEQADGTDDAKPTDLACVLPFDSTRSGHDDGRAWDTSATLAVLNARARGHVLRPSTHGETMPPRWTPPAITKTQATVPPRSP